MKYLKKFENHESSIEKESSYHLDMIKDIFQDWIDKFDVTEVKEFEFNYEPGLYYNLYEHGYNQNSEKLTYSLVFWWNNGTSSTWSLHPLDKLIEIGETALEEAENEVVERLKSAGYECELVERVSDFVFKISYKL